MLVGHVADIEHAKIRQPGLGADRSEFRIVNEDLVSRELVGPGFDLGEFSVESGGGVFRCVSRRFGHEQYCSGSGTRFGKTFKQSLYDCSKEPCANMTASKEVPWLGAEGVYDRCFRMVNYCLQLFLPDPER